MMILAIETSGKVGSVALALAGDDPGDPFAILFERSFSEGLIHGRELAPSVRAALDNTRLAPDGIDLVAVSQGPGSYTSLRVGLAFAKTFAWSVQRPLVGVCSLAVMAENVTGSHAVAVPVLDARWGQVYGAVFARENGEPAAAPTDILPVAGPAWREVVAPLAEAPDVFAKRIPPGSAVFGDSLDRYREILLRKHVTEGDPTWAIPRASVVARLGLSSYLSHRRDESMTIAPLYLRPTEAEVNAGLSKKAGRPGRIQGGAS